MLNVGQAAAVVWDQCVFGPGTAADPEFHCEPFVALHHLDHVDSEFPAYMRLENDRAVTLSRARVLTIPPLDVVHSLRSLVPDAELRAFVERHLEFSPTDQRLREVRDLLSDGK